MDGRELTYLSPLRAAPASGAALGRSLNEPGGPGAGRDGAAGHRRRARRLPVGAGLHGNALASRPQLGLVLKIDRDEALEEFHQAARLTGLAATLLIVAGGLLLAGLRHQRRGSRLLREQIRQERAIFNLKSYAEKIVASVPSGLLVLASDLRILSANRSFLESFSLRHNEVLGRRLEEVVQADGLLPRASARCSSPAWRSTTSSCDLHVTARRGSRPARITVTGIRIAGGGRARGSSSPSRTSPEEERLARGPAGLRAALSRPGAGARRHRVGGRGGAPCVSAFVSRRAEGHAGLSARPPAPRAATSGPTVSIADDRERATGAQSARRWRRGADHEFEYRAVAADGTVSVAARHRPRRCATPRRGRVSSAGITVDLTERKRAEEALARERGPAPPGPEDGGGGPARRRHRARLQQPAHGDPGRQRSHPRRQLPTGPSAAPQRRRASARPPSRRRRSPRQLLAFSRKQVLRAPVRRSQRASSPACTPMLQRPHRRGPSQLVLVPARVGRGARPTPASSSR